MRRIAYFISIVLILLGFLAKAQTQSSELDSLHKVLSHAPSDTVRMFTLDGIASYYAESERDSSMYYCEASIALAEKLEQPIWMAEFLLLKSYLVQKQFNLALSLSLCNEALKILEDDSNDKLAYIPKESRFASEPDKYRKALTMNVYHQLANTMSGAGNREKAIEYYKKEIQVADELGGHGGKMTSNMNIGSIYFRMDLLDSALIYSKEALKYAEITGWKDYEGNTLHTIARVFIKLGQLDSAKYYLHRALTSTKGKNNLPSEITIRGTLANFYAQQNEIDSMFYYASSAVDLSFKLNSAVYISQTTEKLADAWQRAGNLDSAYAYLSSSKTLRDSLSTVIKDGLIEFQTSNFEEQLSLEKAAKESVESRNRIRTYALLIGLGLLAILAFVFYRNNRQKQKANTAMEKAYADIQSTQTQLNHSEKMASLGELTAGIAHEIQNPLNFVNNFSDLNKELLEELKDAVAQNDQEEVVALIKDLSENETKINHHGKRAEEIVKSMLQHSRTGSGEKEWTDINALADEYLRLSYHGLRAKDESFNADFKAELDPDLPKVSVISQDIGRVILNLINNAFHAVKGVKNPQVIVSTKLLASSQVQITVTDNGLGIPDSIKEKIFQPFFTTKPTGEGTGLGLSMSYDIVTKGHGGTIAVKSEVGKGTRFIIQIPIK